MYKVTAVRWTKCTRDRVQGRRGQVSGRMQRSHLRMTMMQAQAQRDDDHREQRAGVAGGAGLVVIRYVAAFLLATSRNCEFRYVRNTHTVPQRFSLGRLRDSVNGLFPFSRTRGTRGTCLALSKEVSKRNKRINSSLPPPPPSLLLLKYNFHLRCVPRSFSMSWFPSRILFPELCLSLPANRARYWAISFLEAKLVFCILSILSA